MGIRTVRNLRRISQIVFFLVFFWLILKTTFEVSFTPTHLTEIHLPYPVSIALQFDPLVGLSTLLATGSLFKGLLWCLVILIPTIFIGRFFCGWVCPLGSANHWISEIPFKKSDKKISAKIESNRYKRYQRIKYYLLFGFLAASLVGSVQIGLFDPLSLLARSIGTVVLPTIHTGSLGVLSWVKGLGFPPLGNAAQFVYDIISTILLPFRQAHFQGILLLGLFFTLVLVLNRIFSRFWCRGICPLGAMLGLFSRFSLFGLQKNEKSCDHCNLCLVHCQGADGPDVGSTWRQAECHLCLNCQAVCPNNSLSFTFYPNRKGSLTNPAPKPQVDISRRMAITSVASGLAIVPLFRSGTIFSENMNHLLIRPPGSTSEAEFLDRCIKCGQCMRVCPNNALHPTMLEAGFEGLWSPILIAKIGYCEPSCTLCGQVCPTGAIAELTLKEKVGDKDTPPNRIGTAFIDRGRCLPWGMATSCIVCEEWCPTSPKSVYLIEEKVRNSQGQEVTLKRPYIDPQYCTGCGACEYACPVTDKAAIYVTSVGETRSSSNQFLLARKKKSG
jgi:polyferredoxin